MKLVPSLQRLTLAALFVSATVTVLASSAEAAPGWRGNWRPAPRRVAFVGPRYGGLRYGRPVYYRRGYGPGPVFAGLVGGIALGAILANPAPAYCPAPVVVVPNTVYDEPAPVVTPAPTPSSDDPAPGVSQGTPPKYRYEDAWGDRWWDTLDECTQAARGTHGPRVIKIVDDESNQTVRTLYWKHDHWISDDGDDDRDRGGE
ncbi:MAG TPA: hypothetical protein VMH61_00195 [Candidatus Acidoferrales bacterium]|nr:hypothetical protein [Candidatus Acidoferrales bacterium]